MRKFEVIYEISDLEKILKKTLNFIFFRDFSVLEIKKTKKNGSLFRFCSKTLNFILFCDFSVLVIKKMVHFFDFAQKHIKKNLLYHLRNFREIFEKTQHLRNFSEDEKKNYNTQSARV